MSVPSDEVPTVIESEIEELTDRLTWMTKTIANLKKLGRAQYTAPLLTQRLALVTESWKDAQQGLAALKKLVHPQKRNSYDFFKMGVMDTAETEFLDFLNYVTAEQARLAAANSNTVSGGHFQAPIELPKMRLPKYGGDPSEWQHFEDVFTSGVINNAGLSDLQRLHQLNACLEGNALAKIKNLKIEEKNFEVAWETLKKEFGLPRIIVAKLLDQLTQLEPIRNDDLASLQQVTIGFKHALAGLDSLGTAEQQRDWLLAHLVKTKLDKRLEWEWEKSQKLSTKYPSYDEMMEFLETHTRAMLVIHEQKRKPEKTPTQKPRVRALNTVVETDTAVQQGCGCCGQSHGILQCSNFLRWTPKTRFEVLKDNKHCILCLSSTHTVKQCRCTTMCNLCSGRHHTLLHLESAGSRRPFTKAANGERGGKRITFPAPRQAKVNKATADSPSHSTSHCTELGTCVPRQVLLATANVRVYGKHGTTRIARALVDQGSETSFISASLVNDLRLARNKTPATVTGLGGGRTQTIKYSVEMHLGATSDEIPTYKANAYVVPKITNYASPTVSALTYEALRNVPLADPDLASSQNIEVLLGADVFASIIRPGFRRIHAHGPIAQETAFGWILSGPADTTNPHPNKINTFHCNVLESLDQTIRRFWEIEEIPVTSVLTKAEEECEAHYIKTVARDATGKFVVELPFNHSKPDTVLGSSFPGSLAALTRLRKKLDTDPTLEREYSEFLTEYESMGHMTRIAPIDHTRLYIPHRAVIREASATTKLRVVFNATSRTAGGCSLNDVLHVGPKLQNDITSVLTRWRLHEYVLVADIEKMFRQILVAPQDRRFQCILWRSPETEQLQAFELNTVTYGTACAPYLAMRTLLELKKQDGDRFPLAAPILEKDIYVDDVFMGAPNKQLLEQIRTQTCGLLQRGGFHLRKWAGNSSELLRNIPHNAHSHAVDLTLFDESELKVLGLQWIPSGDYFYFNLQRFKPSADPITKRTLFSEIAKLYDPLGWLSPVVIRAKILMQSQWLEKLQWDDQVSSDTMRTWNTFCTDWSNLNELKIPRWIRYGDDTISVELHGFCDASLAAYSAVTYLRVTSANKEVITTLLMAKTRVAPIKTQSIPILELNGAVLLSELVVHVERSLAIQVERVVCWTDSTIALAWMRKHASTWKVVVANRVSKIQTKLPHAEWRHVPTRSNPADLNSRGVDAEELLKSELWISGPTWLRQPETSWPTTPASIETEEGKRIAYTHVTTPVKEWEVLFRFSTWSKLLRVIAYCLRVRKTVQDDERSIEKGVVNASELRTATEKIACLIQRTHFAEEYRCLKNRRVIPANSPLKSLSSFLDGNDVMRVGGRLENATLAWEAKHPIILPKHYVSTLIIRQCHVNTLHGGMQLTMYMVRQQFWILGCRNATRTVIHQCMRCVRWRARVSSQIMQDLTPQRCHPARVFSNCGVDYAGPYRVRDSAGRGKTAHKAYIAVFICFATRAVHIELVHDYSTSSFLAALDRFTARRGIPSCMFSDNGTNFVGADRELREHFNAMHTSHEMQNQCGHRGIRWRFNPPSAPHFGGLQEAGVKSVKHHLKRILGEFTPTSEEMQTLLCKIEASLNSRPIAALSDSADDYAPLTPGHFLTGGPLNAIPMRSVENENLSRLTRWRAIQKFHEQLWTHWRRDYLTNLQKRYKWRTTELQFKPNDLVLVQNPLLPPNQWEMGRIEEIFPGKDGRVRVVKVRTAKSTYTRPITRLCRLPVEGELSETEVPGAEEDTQNAQIS